MGCWKTYRINKFNARVKEIKIIDNIGNNHVLCTLTPSHSDVVVHHHPFPIDLCVIIVVKHSLVLNMMAECLTWWELGTQGNTLPEFQLVLHGAGSFQHISIDQKQKDSHKQVCGPMPHPSHPHKPVLHLHRSWQSQWGTWGCEWCWRWWLVVVVVQEPVLGSLQPSPPLSLLPCPMLLVQPQPSHSNTNSARSFQNTICH